MKQEGVEYSFLDLGSFGSERANLFCVHLYCKQTDRNITLMDNTCERNVQGTDITSRRNVQMTDTKNQLNQFTVHVYTEFV